MAHMIPAVPLPSSEASQEEKIFFAFEERLPEDFYVFHSLRTMNFQGSDAFKEREIDFVIFNRKLGILCLEAKAGRVYCQDRTWYYQSHKPMRHGGPYAQSQTAMYSLMEKVSSNYKTKDLLEKCKFLSGACFPSILRKEFSGLALPDNSSAKLTIFEDDLDNPYPHILDIFKLNPNGKVVTTSLTKEEAKLLINLVLAPSFNLLKIEPEYYEYKFSRFLKEQERLLDYLEDQDIAAISGAAGTGKTSLALEFARRREEQGERTLFLCYNRFLKDYLKEHYEKSFGVGQTDFYTIDGLRTKLTHDPNSSFDEAATLLYEETLPWPYINVVIDEGQDMGSRELEESDFLKGLKDLTLKRKGSFFIFYDKCQSIQIGTASSRLPSVIENSECKLTLLKNCRNTRNIINTSLSVIERKRLRLNEEGIDGDPAQFFFFADEKELVQLLNSKLETLYETFAPRDITVLTVLTEEISVFNRIKNKLKRGNALNFSTCRKFKGLESRVVLLIDVDKDTFLDNSNRLLFYVGTSRAKIKLEIFSSMNKEDCCLVYEAIKGKKPKNIKKDFKSLFCVDADLSILP